VNATNALQGLVSGRIVSAFLRAASREGVEAAPGAAQHRWSPWLEFAQQVEHVAKGAADGPALLQRLGAGLLAGDPVLAAVGAVMLEPSRFAGWAVENVLAPGYPVHIFEYLLSSPQTARVTVTTGDSSPVSLAWFDLCAGTLAGLLQHLGLPLCAVASAVDGKTCVYTLTFPPEQALRTPPPRASRDDELRAVLHGLEELREHLLERVRIATKGAEKPSFEHKVAAAARTWRLSPRESQALSCLVRGLSNKETAAELGCAVTTAELHVTRVLRKSGSASRVQLTARFWSAGP
jgi:DNA-binding CsgD family transcriptional regulator